MKSVILRSVIAGGLIATFAGGCSTAKVRVMPGDDGVHKSVARDIEKEGAEEASLDAAKDYCEDHGKSLAVVKESTKYSGDMDEGTRKTVRAASKTASVLDGIGSPVGTAGRAGMGMTSDRDYVSEIVFKCK